MKIKATKQPEDYQTIKIDKATYRRIKILTAITGEEIRELVDRLVVEEADRRGVGEALKTLETIPT